jgi:hypothetical protein
MNEENKEKGFTAKNVLMFIITTITSLIFVYLMIYVVSRGWKKGQEGY